MQKDFIHYPLHYFMLLCLQLIGLWAIFWFSASPVHQFLATLYMAVSYVGWGIIHHMKSHDLHPKIVAEYCLFGIMGVLLLSVLIFKP